MRPETARETRLVIITGMSGAGKSSALRTLEDMGFFCVDNLPPSLIPKFAELCTQAREKITRIAMVVDVRGGEFFGTLSQSLEDLDEMGIKPVVVFLDADDETLVRRFKETRRRHPLSPREGVLDGIRVERQMLKEIRSRAHVVIDTSNLSPQNFRKYLADKLSSGAGLETLVITVMTFGYKHGLPMDADLVFDVRFLPNPYYIEELKPLSGLDAPVIQYVMSSPVTNRFLSRLKSFLDFLVPQYVTEGKSHLTIAIGCTGGRHRSVVIGEYLKEHFKTQGRTVVVEHRDMDRGETGG
ncbi:MAG TPA: RNase adapter RapZ [Firmicutes bacterium]|nr:RNase adapter RapZ [Candidatus Fermentithermobacillaceae bacterium]